MSANFPSGTSDKSADASGRPTTAGQASYNAGSNGAGQRSAESLRAELNNLKADLDNLIARASELSERELSEAYARMMTKFGSIRYAAKGVAAQASRQFGEKVDMTSDYVKNKPLQSVAIAAGIGLLLGMMMQRR